MNIRQGCQCGVFLNRLKIQVSLEDAVDVILAQNVLVGAAFKVARGVNEQDVFIAIRLRLRPGLARFVEYKNGGRDRRAKEKLLRQPDDGFQDVLVDELLTYDAFRRAAEEHAMRNNDPHAAFAFQRDLHHVANEGIIAFAGRRQPTVEAVVRIVGGKFSAPFF